MDGSKEMENICQKCNKGKLQLCDGDDGLYPISSIDDEDNYICPLCYSHHMICKDCELNSSSIVLCQCLGHQGIVYKKVDAAPSRRILRPNKKAFDYFLNTCQYDDELEGDYIYTGDRLNLDDHTIYKQELSRIGYIPSTFEHPIPFCVEDYNQFYLSWNIENLQHQSIPLIHDYYNDKSPDSNYFAINGPDGGFPTFWRCLKCKTDKTIYDK